MTLAAGISKTIMEITGEPRVELAVVSLLEDAVEHRIEKIEAAIKIYEKRYGMGFEEFKIRFENGEIPDSYSYNKETDFLEWEGLVGRIRRYRSILETFLK